MPLIVFAIIAAPFWLAAQWLTSKLPPRTPWWIICMIFILALVPPAVGWFFLWGAVCGGDHNSTVLTAMCMIWEFFQSVMQGLLA